MSVVVRVHGLETALASSSIVRMNSNSLIVIVPIVSATEKHIRARHESYGFLFILDIAIRMRFVMLLNPELVRVLALQVLKARGGSVWGLKGREFRAWGLRGLRVYAGRVQGL